MALVRKDAIKRAAMIDAELGWLRGTALGKLSMLWHTAQEDAGKSTVPKRLLLEWAGVEPEFGDRFLELCCRADESDGGDYIHFLEHRDGGRYFIVGNPEEIERLANDRAQKSNAGKASAEARKAKTGSAIPRGAHNHPDRTETEQPFERSFEQPLDGCSEQRSERISNPSALALASAESVSEGVILSASGGGDDEAKPARKAKPPKSRVTTWEPSDPLAKAFAHLMAFPKYAAVFDREKDRATLNEHATHYSLTVADVVQVCYELRHWTDGPNADGIKSPRGTLATFVKRYVERRDKTQTAAKTTRKEFSMEELRRAVD